MQSNVGSADRIIRLILGLALIVVAFIPGLGLAANPLFQWGAVGIGAVLAVTALVRFCPLYRVFGLSTRKVSKR
ncbi:MAG: hypothetical protein ABS76_06525 [Pelagibacterium sp. SCN 64-44]|nr:MAG: hypothetical protein ABS76_06525 [Pelagibacterium sp. SCN 64-44]